MPEWLRWAFLIAFGVLMFMVCFIINDIATEDEKKIDEEDPDWQDVGWVDSNYGALTPRKEKIMAEYTKEDVEKHAFKIAFSYPLREITEKDVHKIREIFYNDRTIFWYLISKDADESIGVSASSLDVDDEVLSVVYYKAHQSFRVECFEWVSGLTERIYPD